MTLITFTAESIKAILSGEKTMMRRVAYNDICPFKVGNTISVSEINFVVTAIRSEQLNDISESDARQEGIVDGGCNNIYSSVCNTMRSIAITPIFRSPYSQTWCTVIVEWAYTNICSIAQRF